MRYGRERWTTAGATLLALAFPGASAHAESDLMGPLRIRDTTPYNLMRLEMRPASAVAPPAGGVEIETTLSYSNTFVMSGNVARYLEGRGYRGPLTPADVQAILALGEDAYFLDGEAALLDLTLRYALTDRSSLHLTLAAYSFTGGFLDGTIEGFHGSFGLENGGRDLVARDRFQFVSSIDEAQLSSLDVPVEGGLGDPVIGFQTYWPLSGSRWSLALTGEAKLAWRGERLFISTGTHDFGVQAALHGKFRRQGIFFGAGFVSTDGRVFGVELERRVVPTVTLAYEAAVAAGASLVMQLYASEGAGRDSLLPEIRATKYEASLGLRSRRGSLLYGFALTENLKHFENTPDIGLSFTLAWLTSRT